MKRIAQAWATLASQPASRIVIAAVLLTALLGVGFTAAIKGSGAQSNAGCTLNSADSAIKHMIYLQFDNVHFNRDNPNVASDLQQMPHLLNFLTQNGTLFTNDHTILISHTAGGILSSLTGLYPDRSGMTVSNSYDYYKANGFPTFTSGFKYWTDTVDGTDDPLPNMVTNNQQTTPAPWLTFTHAGCNVGGVSAANIELENTSTAPSGDMTRVFGSTEWNEANTPATRAQATTDFVGIAIHCALGASLCDTPNARPDDATIVPGSNDGYKALFGAKYVNPAITGGQACVNATDGSPIADSAGHCGFPGFDGALAKNTLGMVAQMQENGVPVTYAYISDAHDNHSLSRASGPGEADYQAQLAAYDTAFATFFQQLQAKGIDKSNTLFVVTADEGDHFVGGVGTPDPVNPGSLVYNHNACTNLSACPSNQIGEVTVKISSVLPAGEPGYDIHFDDAPTFYVNGPAGQNGPGRTDPSVRKLERDVSTATAVDPYAGGAVPIAQRLADPVEEKTLHMVNSDPKRTSTFTMFGNDDFFFQTTNLSGGCTGFTTCVNPGFAWNHGDFQQEIGNTWVGFVGPGVQHNGIDSTTWTDHTNLRPTILSLLGLKDSYVDDGRVLIEALDTKATPQTLIAHRETVRRLGDAYEQVNAPFGQFAMDTLKASTKALASNDTGDATYTSIEGQIQTLTSQRDALASQIRSALNASAFDGKALDEQQAKGWIDQANGLLAQAHTLADA